MSRTSKSRIYSEGGGKLGGRGLGSHVKSYQGESDQLGPPLLEGSSEMKVENTPLGLTTWQGPRKGY